MHRKSGAQIGLRAAMLAALATGALATGASIERADAQQMQQVTAGFNPSDPQWALGNPFMSSGWGAGSSTNQPAYTAPLGSGVVGLSVASYNVNATSGNFFSPAFAFPVSQQPNWLPNFGTASVTSLVGNYKSAPNTAMFGGLYTTASFGITSISTNPAGFSGLPNFTSTNDAVGFSATAGLGLQLTPQITIEGSVGLTQMPTSTLR